MLQTRFFIENGTLPHLHFRLRQIQTGYSRQIPIYKTNIVVIQKSRHPKRFDPYAEIQKIGVNVNQIAKRVNATGSVYQEDIEEIKGVLADMFL